MRQPSTFQNAPTIPKTRCGRAAAYRAMSFLTLRFSRLGSISAVGTSVWCGSSRL